MGGMRMGSNPHTSVTGSHGLVHHLDNVLVADGSVFPTSGGQNPTLTIMATALRNVTHLVKG
jgi:choline dehydrogenase-like flavoprotein